MEAKYYECHVTTDIPLDEIKYWEICLTHGFKPAKLYKQDGTKSNLDAFSTRRDTDFEVISLAMGQFTWDLEVAGIHWRRRKIEAILFDERQAQHA